MTLVRHIVFWSSLGNFHIKAQFIPGFTNVFADLISRGNFQKFKKLAPKYTDKAMGINSKYAISFKIFPCSHSESQFKHAHLRL
jgi:hypothetical protein